MRLTKSQGQTRRVLPFMSLSNAFCTWPWLASHPGMGQHQRATCWQVCSLNTHKVSKHHQKEAQRRICEQLQCIEGPPSIVNTGHRLRQQLANVQILAESAPRMTTPGLGMSIIPAIVKLGTKKLERLCECVWCRVSVTCTNANWLDMIFNIPEPLGQAAFLHALSIPHAHGLSPCVGPRNQ